MAASQVQKTMSSDEKEARSVWKNLASEYTTMYAPWPKQEKFSIRPPSNGEFIYDAKAEHDMQTMYDANYITHESAMRSKCVPPKSVHQQIVNQKMNCLSTYDDSYKYKKGDRRPAFRPNPTDHQPIQGNCQPEITSVNQETYRAYTKPEFNAAKRDLIIIEQECGVLPTGKDVPLITTVQETFRSPNSPSRRQPIIPETCSLLNKSKMALQTTHMADYTRKQQTRPPSAVPALKKDRQAAIQWKTPGVKLNFTSTFQNDYINHMNVRRPKSFKPLHCYVASDTPFANKTHYSHDFSEKPLQGFRPELWRPEANLKILDKGLFQDTTQYRDTHCQTKYPVERTMLIKPKSTHYGPTKKFYDDTSYSANYRRFDSGVGRSENFKPVRKYTPPDIAFNVVSTAHAHYKGDPAPPSKICKPEPSHRLKVTGYVQNLLLIEMASAYREGANCSEEGFQRFLDSIQARGVMYGSKEHSRDRLHDQVISRALNEFERYWKYIPGGYDRLSWTMKIQINPFWESDYYDRMDYMLLNAPKLYQPY